jgi:hypothetical protein
VQRFCQLISFCFLFVLWPGHNQCPLLPKNVPIKRLRDSTVNVPSGDNRFYLLLPIEGQDNEMAISPPCADELTADETILNNETCEDSTTWQPRYLVMIVR